MEFLKCPAALTQSLLVKAKNTYSSFLLVQLSYPLVF